MYARPHARPPHARPHVFIMNPEYRGRETRIYSHADRVFPHARTHARTHTMHPHYARTLCTHTHTHRVFSQSAVCGGATSTTTFVHRTTQNPLHGAFYSRPDQTKLNHTTQAPPEALKHWGLHVVCEDFDPSVLNTTHELAASSNCWRRPAGCCCGKQPCQKQCPADTV